MKFTFLTLLAVTINAAEGDPNETNKPSATDGGANAGGATAGGNGSNINTNWALDYAICKTPTPDERGNCKSENAYCCLGIGPKGQQENRCFLPFRNKMTDD